MSSFTKYLPKGAKTNRIKEHKSAKSFINTIAPPQTTTRPATRAKKVADDMDKIDLSACDILFINERIIDKLKSKIATVPELQKDLTNLLWIINNSPDVIDKIQAKTNTNTLRKTIQDIEGGFELALYIFRTEHIIDEYRRITTETSRNEFVKVASKRDETKLYRRQKLIMDYLRIAKNYIVLDGYNTKPQKTICEVCLSAEFTSGDDSSILTCKGCGNMVELIDDAPTFKDSERVNMSSRYTYTCRGHFIEAMNRFEGKQNTEIDEAVIETLKRELLLHNLTEDTATKEHIYMFLSEKKLSDYYADINLIYFLITKVNPPDITEYRNELLEMHEQLEEAYHEVKDDDRLNSLNVNWKLFKLLQLLDYPCKKDDFFCLKTPVKQGEHEQKWHDMIDYLKKKYTTSITSLGRPRWRHIRTL